MRSVLLKPDDVAKQSVTDTKCHVDVTIDNRNGEIVTGGVTDTQVGLKPNMDSRNGEDCQNGVVTDGQLSDNRTMDTRNAANRPRKSFLVRRNEERLEKEAAAKGEICGCCFRRLEPSETVWRIPRWTGPMCRECYLERDLSFRYFPPEGSCEGCGRGVVVQIDARYRIHLFCSFRCESRYRWRVIKQKRREGGFTCKACGNAFDPPRSDATHCSSACRQRDYRRRKQEETEKGRVNHVKGDESLLTGLLRGKGN